MSIPALPAKRPQTDETSAIIERLRLKPHPEGGWYREVYRSAETMSADALPARYQVQHCYATSIYFLLEGHDFSAFHRIRSDETWHFYMGSPIALYILTPDGNLTEVILGNQIEDEQVLQFTIMRECWFAAKVLIESSFSLVGCTVSPGFEFADFELADRRKLTTHFPAYAHLISILTRV